MKYLITREQFLSKNTGSVMINEVLENEITWGGSLLGRLINSTIRRVKIGYNETKIDQVLVDLRNELDYLISSSMTQDASKKLHELILKKYLEEIKDISLSSEEDKIKLEKLIGAKPGMPLYNPSDPKRHQETSGVLGDTIKQIRDNLTGLKKLMGSDRDKFLDILSDFSDELRKLTSTITDKGGDLSTTNIVSNFITVLKSLKSILESFEYSNKLKSYEKFLESNTNDTTEAQAVSSIDYSKKLDEFINKIQKEKSLDFLEGNDEFLKLLNNLSKLKSNDIKNKKLKLDGKEVNLLDALKKIIRFVGVKESNDPLYKTQAETVREVWERFLGPFDRIDPHRLTQREVKEYNDMVDDPNKISKIFVFDPNQRPDPIISISKIFTNAYNIYATDYIPSGRPKGRISQKTLREYIKLGDKKSLSVDDNGGTIPGYGPWAVKSTFNKFKNGVLKILQNQEYRKIFANMKYLVPGSEDKFNESLLLEDSQNLKSDSQGQILLKFINDMITPSKLGDFESLVNDYISKYFGVKMEKKEKIVINPIEKSASKEDRTNNLTWFPIADNPSKFSIPNLKDIHLYAVPCKYFKFEDEDKIEKIGLKLIDEDRYKDKKVLFINPVKGMDPISIYTKNSGSISIDPVKITFDKQKVADYQKTISEIRFESIDNWNDGRTNIDTNIHYGYSYIKGGFIYLIHAPVTLNKTLRDKIKNVYVQKLEIIMSHTIQNTDDKDVEITPSVLRNGRDGKKFVPVNDYSNESENSKSKENFSIKKDGVKLSDYIKNSAEELFKIIDI